MEQAGTAPRRAGLSGEDGDFVEVADEELAALDLGERLAERLGHRGLEDALLHAGAEVAEDDLGEVRRLAAGGAAGEEVEEISRLRSGSPVAARSSKAGAFPPG